MYLGRQVVRLIVQHASSRGGIHCARQDEHAVTDRADRASGRPEPGDLLLQCHRAEVLPHAGGMTAGEQQPVELRDVQAVPRDGRAVLRRIRESSVGSEGVLASAEHPEDERP